MLNVGDLHLCFIQVRVAGVSLLFSVFIGDVGALLPLVCAMYYYVCSPNYVVPPYPLKLRLFRRLPHSRGGAKFLPLAKILNCFAFQRAVARGSAANAVRRSRLCSAQVLPREIACRSHHPSLAARKYMPLYAFTAYHFPYPSFFLHTQQKQLDLHKTSQAVYLYFYLSVIQTVIHTILSENPNRNQNAYSLPATATLSILTAKGPS